MRCSHLRLAMTYLPGTIRRSRPLEMETDPARDRRANSAAWYETVRQRNVQLGVAMVQIVNRGTNGLGLD